MIYGYLFCLVATAVLTGMAWGLSLLSLPWWGWVGVTGVLLPVVLAMLIVYGGSLSYVWKTACEDTKEASDETE